jgi:hypothetical protein
MRFYTEQVKSRLQRSVKYFTIKGICNNVKLCTQHEDLRHSIRCELQKYPSDVLTIVYLIPYLQEPISTSYVTVSVTLEHCFMRLQDYKNSIRISYQDGLPPHPLTHVRLHNNTILAFRYIVPETNMLRSNHIYNIKLYYCHVRNSQNIKLNSTKIYKYHAFVVDLAACTI